MAVPVASHMGSGEGPNPMPTEEGPRLSRERLDRPVRATDRSWPPDGGVHQR